MIVILCTCLRTLWEGSAYNDIVVVSLKGKLRNHSMHKHDYDVSMVLIETIVLVYTFTHYYAWNVHDHDDAIVF